MDHNNLQDNNGYNFTESSNLQQSNIIQSEQERSSNTNNNNYNNVNVDFSMMGDPTSYTNRTSQSYSTVPSYPSPANSSVIFGFEIPGFKIISIPISSPMSLNLANNFAIYSLDIPGFKILVIPTSSQFQQ